MADIAGRPADRAHGRPGTDVFGDRPSSTRHPLVAAAMVLPLAVLLAVVFGGWDAVVTQASSVAGMLGR
ncbi:hypothetical protein FHS39_004163 [Streptomyces olivoverticillatus]|uniref:Uncharacterized protein n=1 Tax=Streptomyces olivoverticillatus TaxID=66427 RepID=A0A7W7LSU2_9ACTN|nr:hypothetical protein [Streptomyces olivoverticillatus]MBB4895096.1 hypothetical protein [Streptomyces olivoverticillatus]